VTTKLWLKLAWKRLPDGHECIRQAHAGTGRILGTEIDFDLWYMIARTEAGQYEATQEVIVFNEGITGTAWKAPLVRTLRAAQWLAQEHHQKMRAELPKGLSND
jgi:hypothetical protein